MAPTNQTPGTPRDTDEARTLTPVTTGGWYERTDGCVGEYCWRDGQPVCDQIVADWGAVPSKAEEAARYQREGREQAEVARG